MAPYDQLKRAFVALLDKSPQEIGIAGRLMTIRSGMLMESADNRIQRSGHVARSVASTINVLPAVKRFPVSGVSSR